MYSSNKTLINSRTALLLVLAFFTTFTGACSQTVDDNSTPETLAQTILSAIKTNDLTLFQKHVASEAEIFTLDTLSVRGGFGREVFQLQRLELQKARAKGMSEAQAKAEMNKITVESAVKEYREQAQSRHQFLINQYNFDQIRRNFESDGLLDWSNVAFKKFSFETTSEGKIVEDGVIEFTNGEFTGRISLVEFYKGSDGKWRIVSTPRYQSYR